MSSADADNIEQPFDLTITSDERVAAMVEYMRGLKTPPLRLSDIAAEFHVHRSTARALVEGITGAEQHGSRWRIPVCEMPVQYQREIGLL